MAGSTRRGNGRDKGLGRGVVGINNTELGATKELALGFNVICESLVVIKMFVSNVSHDGDFYRNAEDAILSEGVGGNFEDEILSASVSDFFNTVVECGGIDGGHVLDLLDQPVRVAIFDARSAPSNGSHKAGFYSGVI